MRRVKAEYLERGIEGRSERIIRPATMSRRKCQNPMAPVTNDPIVAANTNHQCGRVALR